jgi:hypothetical protein
MSIFEETVLDPFSKDFEAGKRYMVRYRGLLKSQKELDYDFGQFFSDLRSEWNNKGEAGDKGFCWWVGEKLNLTHSEIRDCLIRARAFKTVAPAHPAQMAALGGRKQAEKVLNLPAPDRSRVISHAKTQNITLDAATRIVAPHCVPAPAPTHTGAETYKMHCRAMAKHLDESGEILPKNIQVIVSKYL